MKDKEKNEEGEKEEGGEGWITYSPNHPSSEEAQSTTNVTRPISHQPSQRKKKKEKARGRESRAVTVMLLLSLSIVVRDGGRVGRKGVRREIL